MVLDGTMTLAMCGKNLLVETQNDFRLKWRMLNFPNSNPQNLNPNLYPLTQTPTLKLQNLKYKPKISS